ncbi:MAG: hypothetical protein GF411_00370 [Candidatus Lokiarchaeota archaeon]|nr:hypothetical protein [Candidatus Lokiarchaeota archaeon]
MSLIKTYQNRGLTKRLTMKDANGDVIRCEGGDKVRVRIQRMGETPQLEVVSGSPTVNGTKLTPAKVGGNSYSTLRLDDNDLDFAPGIYSFLFDYFDADDSEEWKNVDRQVFILEES